MYVYIPKTYKHQGGPEFCDLPKSCTRLGTQQLRLWDGSRVSQQEEMHSHRDGIVDELSL